MLDTITTNLAAFQLLWGAVLAPIIGWLGYFIRSIAKERRKTKHIIQILKGQPPEAKRILVQYFNASQHTLNGDPNDYGASLLLSQGILIQGPSAGTFSAINRYLTLKPEFWILLPKWIIKDAVAQEFLFELPVNNH